MTWGRRLVVWLLTFGLGQFVAVVVPLSRGAELPPAVWVPLGLVIGVALVVVFERLAKQQGEAFAVLVSGEREACERVLARRASGGLAGADPFGSMALSIAVGNTEATRAWLAREKTLPGLARRMKDCVEAHLDLATATDLGSVRGALRRLLALPPLTVVLSREHYRAWLIATAACRLAAEGDEEAAALALPALAGSRDPVVRVFASWVRTSTRAPLDAAESPDDARRGARLAAAHGLAPLAQSLDSRAAALERARAAVGPYRR